MLLKCFQHSKRQLKETASKVMKELKISEPTLSGGLCIPRTKLSETCLNWLVYMCYVCLFDYIFVELQTPSRQLSNCSLETLETMIGFTWKTVLKSESSSIIIFLFNVKSRFRRSMTAISWKKIPVFLSIYKWYLYV